MEKAMSKKFFNVQVWGGLAVLLAGMVLGVFFYRIQNYKTVVFRVSNARSEMDYDFMAGLSYLKSRFEENGYKVLGTAYAGAPYPRCFDKAGVNVYVRGFWPFYDLRLNEEAVNVYYIHRIMEIIREEMQGYDYYLSSQQGIDKAIKDRLKLDFLESGAVKHEALTPAYDKDVVYIYEYGNMAYEAFLKQHLKAKIYSGRAFAAMSYEEQKQELSSAKLVVYEMGEAGLDDKNYVPYAVYDIISYGRPVLTNYKKPLKKMFSDDIYLFDKRDKMVEMTAKAFAIGDDEREKKALAAREKLRLFENKNRFFMQNRSFFHNI